jgi:phosphoserine aminotransferase
MVNTPPTFAVLVAARMIGWLIENGGLEAAAKRSRERSARLYDAIDRSGFYSCAVSRGDRSWVNVCFRLPEERLEEAFLREAEAAGLLHLRGHLRVGGLRASLYSSTPDEAVDALVAFMADFQKRNG